MYQVLARKYRPRNFNELVGQNHVSRALTSALDRGRLHHAYLFTGTRGVGKTTIARILAKCLNCETGITSTPCEVCATCKSVNEGRFIDLIEIDAASRTKVEDTRELLDNVPYAPTQGRFKVYLIDEVHMLSTHSFNALLKTLEEPPEHVKFLFATTDPQKLPITVISRCLQFTLRPLAVDEITTHLTDVLHKESIEAEQDAIWQIAESAQGSLRDAMSLTDQAIAYGQGAIHHQDVKDMLGLIDRTIIYDLILAIHQNQQARISQLLMQFRQQALDVSMVLDQLISTLHELALLQYLPDLALKYSAEINQKIMRLSAQVTAQDLQLYYQIACKGRADLQLAVTQEQGFEMTVLRLLAFRPMQPSEISASAPVQTAQPVAHVEPAAVSEALTPQSDQTEAHASPLATDAPLTQDEKNEALNSDGFFSDEYDDEQDDFRSQATVNEPSSDDFLDEAEFELSPEPEGTKHQLESEVLVDVQISSEAHTQNADASQIDQIQSPDQNQIIFDPSNGETLFGLDALAGGDQVVDLTPDYAFESIAPLETVIKNSPVTEAQAEPDQDGAEAGLFAQDMTVAAVVESFVQEEIVQQPQNSVTVSSASVSHLMPQDILKLPVQDLQGEWTVDKWEYWFRHSDLSPAVQELAQHGVMIGTIDGESNFHIPKKYEQLLTQMQHLLEQALHSAWPATRFNVVYGDVSERTPYVLLNARKEQAYVRASELLHSEPTVKSLIQAFNGELHNIQLK
ncbi:MULTISPECIES: DNA polymerase III subunit gamma/tau [Acinetobacter]|jgi:DNA polymerase-3 subunit gamma/tau|uniref:DNA polymerase III subunit gamma/tau n=1 Tax=Acinetobacter TaxID=469 RepID=UPI000EA0B4EF|nr:MULTISPECIES: DNA polymerase III subunit gamma/tau [Acinetobacter]RKG46678.1 DNA polymerase III subunit gamma/tau [Acinetobacter cumulans]RZG62072.1 DNA polymerase III subunit gamma/tau [Acinetobacter sp. WCHAc060006]